MSEIDIDFGEAEVWFLRSRTVCFVSESMFFSHRTDLLSYVAFYILSDSGTLSSVDHFGNCRFSSFCLTYSSRSEQSSSPLPNLLRAVRVGRYISVCSRKMIRRLCCLARRSPMHLPKTQKNSPHSFIKTLNGVLMLFASFRIGFPMIRRSPFGSRAVLTECFPPEGLAALDGRCRGKVPERTVKESGREPGESEFFLPELNPVLRESGKKRTRRRRLPKPFPGFPTTSDKGVLPVKETPRTGLRNTDPGDRPRPSREVLPRRTLVPKPEGLP